MRQKGFTLLELLIVIAIIGGLAAIGLTVYPGAQKSARDGKRKTDLNQYRTVLETYANRNNGFYPSFNSPGTGVGGGTALCNALGLTGTCPDDLQNSYRYISAGGTTGATATSFVLYSTLERLADGAQQYWIVCSNGSVGRLAVANWTPSATCPSGLQE